MPPSETVRIFLTGFRTLIAIRSNPMMKTTLTTVGVALFFIPGEAAPSQDERHSGGPVPKGECITQAEYDFIESRISYKRFQERGVNGGTILFEDPMGDGGLNSFGKTVTNYVDLIPTGALKDFNCGTITYDGHRGTDIELLNFYEMDEGVPVLCAAPGVVAYTHDGEYDRNTEWITGRRANAVVVSHSDGSTARYLHMRKSSVAVDVGDNVDLGDTLGFVGSSGFSSGPHIHFEIRQDETAVDPFYGPCQPDSSRWVHQKEYVFDLPFEKMDDGLTTIPLSWAMISERPPTKRHVKAQGTIYSWVRLRNARKDDTLTWKFYANGSLWDEYSFSPGQTYSSSWWYVWWNLPASSSYYGNWVLEIYHNDNQIAIQLFAYDERENQLPTIENLQIYVQKDEPLNGEFVASDPDGSIFSYEVVAYPPNGTLTQYGGRKRKFTYVPNNGFVGQDTVVFYALDDENAAGEYGIYVFNVVESFAVREAVSQRPTDFKIFQNYPNPFNSSTTLSFDVPRRADVVLEVYDILGRQVRTIVQSVMDPGHTSVRWDGTDDWGQPATAGVYLYQMQAGDFVQTRKMLLLR